MPTRAVCREVEIALSYQNLKENHFVEYREMHLESRIASITCLQEVRFDANWGIENSLVISS